MLAHTPTHVAADCRQVDEAKKWYKHALRVKDSASVRIKLALLLPPVPASKEDMTQHWNASLVALKALLKRPSLKVPRDAFVCA